MMMPKPSRSMKTVTKMMTSGDIYLAGAPAGLKPQGQRYVVDRENQREQRPGTVDRRQPPDHPRKQRRPHAPSTSVGTFNVLVRDG